MDSRQAREILLLYRPGSTDAADPLMAGALDQARRDPELAAWFQEHCAVYTAIREKLKAVPVPPGLKRKIIVERMDHARIIPLPGAVKILAAAAAIVVLSAVAWFAFNPPVNPETFDRFRDHMARSVQRGTPYMLFVATNQADIREYFRSNNAPVNLAISTNLAQLPGVGGSVMSWNDHQVEMLCLEAGTPARKNPLWLFIIGKSDLTDPPSARPQFAPVVGLMTVSWTAGDKVYLLSGAGTEKDLQKFLE